MKGTDVTTHVNAREVRPTIDRNDASVGTWILKCARKLTTIDAPNNKELRVRWYSVRSWAKKLGNRYTIMAPTVIPNRATDTATNAKWYHRDTLKMRVRRISYIKVANVTMNRPI